MGASQRSERVNGGASGLSLLQQRVVVEVDEEGQRKRSGSGRKELAREWQLRCWGPLSGFEGATRKDVAILENHVSTATAQQSATFSVRSCTNSNSNSRLGIGQSENSE